MAVTDSKPAEKPATPVKPPAPVAAVSAPGWLLPLYLGGMTLVFIGERVLAGLEKGAGFVTGLGVLAVLGATLLRFAPRFRSGGDRRSIEGLLAILSVGGLVALALYGLSTPWGNEHFGIDGLADATKTRTNELLTVAFSALFVLSTLPMIFAETALRPMRHAAHPESRRVRAAAGAGLTLAVAALYGALFVYAASGAKLDVDYSYFKTSRPSESTVKLAQSLPDPVRVVAFFPQVNEVKAEVERYLNELRPQAPKLQIEIRDRLLAPKLAKELRATQDGAIVLARGTTTQNVTIGTELKQAQAKLKTLDRDFQEQLTKLARARRTAYLSVGHGELNDSPKGPSDQLGARSASIVRTLLQRLNYLVKDIGLAQGLAKEVPDDADLIVVLGPTEPFAPEELAALDRYVKRNGKLFLALDADAFSTRDFVEAEAAPVPSPAPSAKAPAPPASGSAAPAASAAPPVPPPPSAGPLNDLAGLVGLQYSTDVLANERMHARVRNDETDRTRLVTQSFSSHASVSSLNRGGSRVAFVVFGSGSLEKARTATQKMDFAVKAPSGTFPDRNRNYTLDRETEKVTTYNLAAAVTLTAEDAALAAANAAGKPPEKKNDQEKKDKKGEKTAPPEMRAFVVADADALSDFVLGAVVPNQMLFVDAVRWLVGEETFAGPPNTEEDKRIQHTKQQDLTWFYLTIFGVPGLVLAGGVFASRRSRRERGGKK
jgi:hypothetical protein